MVMGWDPDNLQSKEASLPMLPSTLFRDLVNVGGIIRSDYWGNIHLADKLKHQMIFDRMRKLNKTDDQPKTVSEHVHSSVPTLLDTCILYSAESDFSAVRIFKVTVLSFTVILDLRPPIISFPSLNHFTLSSGLPLIVHSSVAESPAVTLIEAAGSTILAGSGTQTHSLGFKKKRMKRASTAFLR